MSRPPRRLVFLLAALSATGPFAIDTYLPAFPAIAADLGASDVQIQQTLPAYLFPFAFMMLWHGALSDALGRRRVILVGLGFFSLASILCATASSIEMLLLGRALQGLAGGVGMVVSRAIVRDLFDGADAQRMMASMAILFGIAPAIAPIIGGWILHFFAWEGIFWFLAGFSALMLLACLAWLPETLAPAKRQTLHPVDLWHAYVGVFTHHRFRRLALANGFNFIAVFIYVLSAPVFLIRHLGLSPQSFAIMFVPVVAGMMIGAAISGRLAGKLSPHRTIVWGYAIMALAAGTNLLLNLSLLPGLPWSLLPLPLYTCGMALAMPSLQLLAIDLFPERRGLASSCLGVIQTGTNALAAAVIIPILWDAPLHLAAGMAAFLVLGATAFRLSLR
jgi:DHA1 family bicyclomycin/chloramphenicol resistance-like MFS transporter